MQEPYVKLSGLWRKNYCIFTHVCLPPLINGQVKGYNLNSLLRRMPKIITTTYL